MIKPIIIGLLLMTSALLMVSSIDVGDESDCIDGEIIKTVGGLWTCQEDSGLTSGLTGGNKTLKYANQCDSATCGTFYQVAQNEN